MRSLSTAGPITLLWRPRRRRRQSALAPWMVFGGNALVVLLALAITQLVALFV